jgi:hypothetical protein
MSIPTDVARSPVLSSSMPRPVSLLDGVISDELLSRSIHTVYSRIEIKAIQTRSRRALLRGPSLAAGGKSLSHDSSSHGPRHPKSNKTTVFAR